MKNGKKLPWRRTSKDEGRAWIPYAAFWIQAVLAVIGVVTIGVYWLQLRQMTLATYESAQATRAAEEAAYQSCIGAQISRSALIEAQSGDSDSHAAAMASMYQAIAAMRSETAAFEVSKQNAIVIPGHSIEIPFNLVNSGKTSAFKFKVKFRAEFISRDDEPALDYPINQISRADTPRVRAGGDIESGDSSGLINASVRSTNGRYVKANDEDVQEYQRGDKDVLFYGVVDYTDIFQVPHWYRFCNIDHKISDGAVINSTHKRCVDYNRSDINSALSMPMSVASNVINIPEIKCTKPL